MRLTIAIVSNRDHKPQFTESLLGLVTHAFQHGPSFGLQSLNTMIARQVSLLPRGRQLTVDRAIKENNSTHLLMIDDDMMFGPDALQVLASRNKPVIGANYVCKGQGDIKFTAYDMNNHKMESRGKTGIEQATKIGTGFMLIDLRVLTIVPAPHFEIIWLPNEAEDGYLPEDFYFCKKLIANNIPIYVDHDVSQKIGHVGDFVYSLNSFGKLN